MTNNSTYPILCLLLGERPSRLSQAMHNAGFQALQLPYVYVAVDVQDTDAAIAAVRTLGVRGASVTIPHKERACALVDELTPDAAAIGAVNTIINEGSVLRGENTDWIGVIKAIEECPTPIGRASAVVVGAGGAARAAIVALRRLGFGTITVANRTFARAEALAVHFSVKALALEELSASAAPIDLLVQTTPAGSPLGDPQALCLPAETLGALQPRALFEMVTRETPTTRWASSKGIPTLLGDRMLLHQAIAQFRLFTGVEPPRNEMDEALKRELAAQR